MGEETREKNTEGIVELGDGHLVINGVSLDFDLLDADVVDRFHEADEAVVARLNDREAFRGLSQGDEMRLQCRIVEDFFDQMFGGGTAEKVFGGSNNHIGKHMAAFADLMNYAMRAPREIEKITGRYSQQRLQNREQRRASAKADGKPAAPNHYDNVKEITRARQEAAVKARAEESGDEALRRELEKQGITMEQLRRVIRQAKEAEDGE